MIKTNTKMQTQTKQFPELFLLSHLAVSSHALMRWCLASLNQLLPLSVANFLILESVVEQSIFHSLWWLCFVSIPTPCVPQAVLTKCPFSFGGMWNNVQTKQESQSAPLLQPCCLPFLPLLGNGKNGKTHLPEKRAEMSTAPSLLTDRAQQRACPQYCDRESLLCFLPFYLFLHAAIVTPRFIKVFSPVLNCYINYISPNLIKGSEFMFEFPKKVVQERWLLLWPWPVFKQVKTAF